MSDTDHEDYDDDKTFTILSSEHVPNRTNFVDVVYKGTELTSIPIYRISATGLKYMWNCNDEEWYYEEDED